MRLITRARNRIAAVFALAAALTSVVAQAEWQPFATTKLGERMIDVYVDPDRVRKQDAMLMVWQLDNIRGDVPNGAAHSAVRLFALDCNKMSTALAELVLYPEAMAAGTPIKRDSSKTFEFEVALPDTVAEHILVRFCSEALGLSGKNAPADVPAASAPAVKPQAGAPSTLTAPPPIQPPAK